VRQFGNLIKDAKALVKVFIKTRQNPNPKKLNLRRSGVCLPFLGRGRSHATGTTDASVGTAELLANLSNKFWRRRRYSSSLYVHK